MCGACPTVLLTRLLQKKDATPNNETKGGTV